MYFFFILLSQYESQYLTELRAFLDPRFSRTVQVRFDQIALLVDHMTSTSNGDLANPGSEAPLYQLTFTSGHQRNRSVAP